MVTRQARDQSGFYETLTQISKQRNRQEKYLRIPDWSIAITKGWEPAGRLEVFLSCSDGQGHRCGHSSRQCPKGLNEMVNRTDRHSPSQWLYARETKRVENSLTAKTDSSHHLGRAE